MIDEITKVLQKYQGQQVEFAIEFEKEGGTLPQQLAKLFEREHQKMSRNDKEKYINELEQMVLVWNNNVIMSKLKEMRDKLEEEAK